MKPTDVPEAEGPHNMENKKGPVTVLLQIFLSIAVLGCGVALAAYYLKSGPEAKPRKRAANLPLVRIAEINYDAHRLHISGMGTVLAAKEINLTPGVGGEIIAMSDKMVPGGFFAKDDTLVTIDPIDYQLAVRQLKSEVAQAKNDLALEMGNQRIAQKEFELLGQKVSATEKRLMLRYPQLEMKKATLHGVEARLAQAELNLKRAKVLAPFNGVVLSRSVNFGARISQSTNLSRLVGTDEFWLKLAIPTSKLQWISFPNGNKTSVREGSKVKIFLQEKAAADSFRLGRVIRLAADVEERGRMAAVYVAVKDPLSLLPANSGKPKLLLGSFVRAEIEGAELASVVPINRDHLREGNTVWLLKDDNTLAIREVTIVARTNEQVLISSGLADGDKLIISALSAPVAGTPLKLLGQDIEQPDLAQKKDGKKQKNKQGADH